MSQVSDRVKSVVLVLVLAVMPAVLAQENLRAGAAKASIVPPHPTGMGGFFDRFATFTGVDTTVYARGLVCSDGATTQAIVALDLIGITDQVVKLAREQVTAATGIPGEQVLISATHDHSAPSGFAGMSLRGEADEDKVFTQFLVDQITEVVKEAQGALRPATLSFAYGHLDNITRNRQQNNTVVIDPEVGVLKVQAADSREIIGVLVNFTGHPVILGSDNLKLSSEYPGRTAAVVEEVLGGVCVYTQGACGDITMIRSGDPREEIKRIGNIVAGEVIKTASLLQPGTDVRLASVFKPVQVEPRKLPSLKEAKKNLAVLQARLDAAKKAGEPEAKIKKLERDADAAQTTVDTATFVKLRPHLLDEASHACVQVMQWGPLAVVGIPGEMFVEYQLEMKQRVKQATGRPLIVVGYANDYIGYIVTPRAKFTGGYEQAISRVSHTAGRTLTEAAMGLVEEVVQPPAGS